VTSSVPVFALQKVDTVPSQPNNSLFFRAGDPGCTFCATFIGDYNGLAVGSDHAIHGIWTDMRRQLIPSNPNSAVQDAFYARIPPPA
jgi:hypothetical protein